MNAIASTKPDRSYDYRVVTERGYKIDVHSDHRCSGAWLQLHGHDHCLSVCTETSDQDTIGYIGYRDGSGSSSDKIALSVDKDGEVTFQIALDRSDVRVMTLAKLETIIRHALIGPA